MPATRLFHVACLLLLTCLAACGEGPGEPGANPTARDNADSDGAASGGEQVLNIYNWSDYIGPETIAGFERETGITVNYDVFDSNEVLEAKLLAGHSGYDIVVPSASFLARQVKAGLFQALDRVKLPHYNNLDADILHALAVYDPDNTHAVPYMWGTTGIGYNRAELTRRLPGARLDSWGLLFDPDTVARLADCGVALLDAPSEVFPAARFAIGLPGNSTSEGDLGAAEAALASIRPYVRYFHSSQYINDLANGDICIALGWSGDVLQAQARAREAANGNDIVYVVPREGALLWIDVMAIPKDAPHPVNAHRFLDYLMRPEVIAAISNAVHYANANAEATELVTPEVRDDPGIYPDAATRARLLPAAPTTPDFDRAVTRAWTRVKSGL